MKCALIQQELIELTGQELSHSLSQHLSECCECSSFWTELITLSDLLVTENFELSESESERLLQNIEDGIALRTIKLVNRRSFKLTQLIPIAASILLLFGINRMKPDQNRQITQIAETTIESDYYEPEETMVSELLSEYTSYRFAEPSETLLGDLTDDELAYLNDNFDVGDIL